jgi:hypothetical protein
LLSDRNIVAFELPKLPGLRQQAFDVIDRALDAPPSRKAKQEPQKAPKRTAGKLAALLDGIGAVRAVASARSRFLFGSAPVLFFADVPSAKLKVRSANKLRRDLVGIGVRACVLSVRSDFTTLMLWPSTQANITAFIDAAAPEHRIHPEFEAASHQPIGRPAQAAGGTDRRPAKHGSDREARLLAQIAALQRQVDALARAQSAQGALEQLGLDDARLKSMLKLLHPDKHGNSEAATEAAKWLNAMRALLKGEGQA